ncbi:leucine-rich repeat domain-containing protein [Butyrivibrio sp. ob235]|uniref:leucine-rich repeat domain-containing protein n=1 Tax=Butyrivibrio sp. ob235 TaxID=1761780 RepID=UPI0015876E36|nr:leucine-rich repeat domain-containing protein [Butyrivibrio sp. ob235]
MPNTSSSIITASANTGSVEHRLHYYFLQTDAERACYDAIIESAKNPLPIGTNIYRMSNEDKIKYGIELPEGADSPTPIGIAHNAVEADYPEIMEYIRYGFEAVDVWHDDENYTSYMVAKIRDNNNYSIWDNQIKSKIATMKSAIVSAGLYDPQDIPKSVLNIHDYYVKQLEYDTAGQFNGDWGADCRTAYGALVQGKAVCVGYSRGYKCLLDAFGIDCAIVSGTSNGAGHEWNVVKIGDDWYEQDLTWADTEDLTGSVDHSYFNRTTSDYANKLKKKHVRNSTGLDSYIPLATGTTYTYTYIAKGVSDADYVEATDVRFNETSGILLYVGDSMKLDVTVTPANATESPEFRILGDDYSTLSDFCTVENGVITAHRAGEGSIEVHIGRTWGNHRLLEVRERPVTTDNISDAEQGNTSNSSTSTDNSGNTSTPATGDSTTTPSSDNGNSGSSTAPAPSTGGSGSVQPSSGGNGGSSNGPGTTGGSEQPSGNAQQGSGLSAGNQTSGNSGKVTPSDITDATNNTDTAEVSKNKEPEKTVAEKTAVVARASEFTVNNLMFKVTSDSTAEFESSTGSSTKTVSVPSNVTDENGNSYVITRISSGAFKNNRKLTKVTIPSTVKQIGAGAFYGCTNLKTVTINVSADGDIKIDKNAFKKLKKGSVIKVKGCKGKVKKKVVKAIEKRIDKKRTKVK